MEEARAGDRRRARAVRRQHARVHPAGGAPHVRAARAAAAPHAVRGSARARRRARPRLPQRPRGAAAVHPRVPAGAHRRRRRRRRAARASASRPTSSSATSTRCPSGRCTAAPSSCTTCTPTGARPGREELADVGCRLPRVRRRGHERGRRDAPRLRVERAADRRGRHPRHDGRVPRQGPPRAWRRPSSPGCGSGRMLVDAKGVSQLYEGRVRRLDIVAARRRRARRDGGGRHRRRAHPRVPPRLLGHAQGHLRRLMINFRFHVVVARSRSSSPSRWAWSIGAGVIDRGVVDTLNNRLDRVEAKSDRIEDENDIADACQRSATRTSSRASQPFALAARLTATSGGRRGAGRRRRSRHGHRHRDRAAGGAR